ncbi:MAG: acetoin utilization protein AcuB [Saprospiraceae bacterium]|jgi:acetoin utilization protein AcuB
MYNKKLSEIMTTNLVTASPGDTMETVEKVFKNNDFHHLPIIDSDRKLVGILSKSDYLMMCDSMTIFKNINKEMQNRRFFHSVLIKDVMKKNIAKLKPDNTVMVAAGFFKENLFHAVPIVDDENRLLGIVTTFDLLNLAFSESFGMS